jgi:hypothetical protein
LADFFDKARFGCVSDGTKARRGRGLYTRSSDFDSGHAAFLDAFEEGSDMSRWTDGFWRRRRATHMLFFTIGFWKRSFNVCSHVLKYLLRRSVC